MIGRAITQGVGGLVVGFFYPPFASTPAVSHGGDHVAADVLFVVSHISVISCWCKGQRQRVDLRDSKQ